MARKGTHENERALATALQRDRGRTQHWSKHATKAEVKKQGGVMFSMRLSAAELADLRRRASERGITISQYIRERALSDEATITVVSALGQPVYAGANSCVIGEPINMVGFSPIGSSMGATMAQVIDKGWVIDHHSFYNSNQRLFWYNPPEKGTPDKTAA